MKASKILFALAVSIAASNITFAGSTFRESYILPRTIRELLAESHAVVYGRVESARKKVNNDLDPGQTDFIVQDVLLPHAVLKDCKVFVLPRYIPKTDPTKPLTFVAFASVTNGKLEFHAGRQTDERGVAYVRGIKKLDPKNPVEMLKFYLLHIEDKDKTIDEDAFDELNRAKPAVRHQAARTMSADKVWSWLRKPDIKDGRRNVYAKLLASCGKSADADDLFELHINGKIKDGIFYSALCLNPKKYGPSMKAMAADAKISFLTRYGIWRATLDLYEAKSESISQDELIAHMAVFLDQADTADFPISAFREYKRWEFTDRIIEVYEKNKAQIVRNQVVRFALQSPRPAASAFIAKVRKSDPELVRYLEDELKGYE